MNYVLAVIHPVVDPVAAAEFLVSHLGFEEQQRGPGFRLLSNGSVSLRLITQREDAVPAALCLDVKSRDLQTDAARLLALDGVGLLVDEHFPNMHRAELTVTAPYGLQITLSRRYTEDELGILPSLPTNLDWEPDVADLIRRLLRMVPLGFRDGARSRAVEAAEALAASGGALNVGREQALRGLIGVTPLFQHAHLRELLANEGIPSDHLFDA